jgi:hypothetical protein
MISHGRYIAFVFAFIFSYQSWSQAQQIPLQRWFTHEVDRTIARDSQIVHIGNKPLLVGDVAHLPIKALARDSTKVYLTLFNYLYRKHLVELTHNDVRVTIDPLLYFALWKDAADTSAYVDTTRLFQNTRGIKVAGVIGDRFGFETGFYENQAQWPEFMRQQAEETGVAPGMGRWKRYRFAGFDYGMSYAYLSYQFNKMVRIGAGHGKHFIGHGYRSLLLSDAAFNYPYLSATLQSPNRKWQYTSRYAGLQTLERLPLGEVPEALFKRKSFTMHYLSWSPNAHFEIGLFESIVWNRFGNHGTHMPAWGAYVPIIGVNTASIGWQQANNVLTGLNIRFSPRSDVMCYGQFAADQLDKSGLGWQFGLKWMDIVPRLDAQIEYNQVGSTVYTHDQGFESYSHFNQSLGTPTGPDSEEILAILEYQYRRLVIRSKAQQILSVRKMDVPWYTSDYALPSNSYRSSLWQFENAIGIRINVKYNAELLFTWLWREQAIQVQDLDKEVFKSQVFGLSLRTSLNNLYNDF